MRFQSKYTPILSWGISMLFVLTQFFLQSIAGIIAKSWQIDFQLSPTELGLLTSAFYVTYVLMQIPVGYCYDRFRARNVLCCATALLAVSIALLAISQTFWQACLARVLMGLGSSFGFVGMLYLTASWFPPQRFGLLVGIVETFCMLAMAVMEMSMGWFITYYSWRLLMTISSVVVALIFLLTYLFVYDQEKAEESDTLKLGEAFAYVLTSRYVWWAGMFGFAVFSMINVVVALWGIPFLAQQYPQYSLQTASLLMALVFVGTGIGAPVSGYLTRFIAVRHYIMAFVAALMMVLFGCLIYIPHLSFTLLVLIFLLLGVVSSGYIPIFAYIREGVPLRLQASTSAATNMVLMSSASILQPAIGKMLDLGFTLPHAFNLIMLFLGLALVISLKFNNLVLNKTEKALNSKKVIYFAKRS